MSFRVYNKIRDLRTANSILESEKSALIDGSAFASAVSLGTNVVTTDGNNIVGIIVDTNAWFASTVSKYNFITSELKTGNDHRGALSAMVSGIGTDTTSALSTADRTTINTLLTDILGNMNTALVHTNASHATSTSFKDAVIQDLNNVTGNLNNFQVQLDDLP